MTSRRLDRLQQALLCSLADPEAPAPEVGALSCLDPDQLVSLCDHHAIGPVVWRKLAPLTPRLLPGWQAALGVLGNDLRIATGITLSLEALALRLTDALVSGGVPHRLVKGAAFAGALYPQTGDRPYTDIDILVPGDALDTAGQIMQASGLTMIVRKRPEKTELYREQKWIMEGQPHVLVEVHTDLVHLPALRRRVTFGHAEAAIADRNGEMPAAGHLLTAVVHGALGHKFHQLKLAVDVLQAIRRLGPADLSHAIDAGEALGLSYELAASAQLTTALFPVMESDPRVVSLRALRKTGGQIDRDTVVNAHLRNDLRSRFRRHAFRWQQRRQPKGNRQ